MRLKIYRAPSVAEAMAQVRAELGPDALIVSTRRVGQTTEITVALEPAEEAIAEEAPAPAAPGCGLSFHGLPPAIAAQLQGADMQHCVRALIRFGPLPIGTDHSGQESRPLLLTGAPGAGKTLSITRLATRLVLAGLSPLVITTDCRRAGAPEELAAYTRLLGLNLLVAATPAALRRAMGQRKTASPVLIDTAGINPFLAEELAGIAALVEAGEATPVLVLPAGLDAAEASEQACAFGALGIRHLLPTRLDLSRRLGGIIAAAVGAKLILTEAGISSGVSDGLVPVTPAFLAERLKTPLGSAPPAPTIAKVHRAPVFPAARAQAASTWNDETYGHDRA